MKIQLLKAFALLMFSAMIFTACGEDDEPLLQPSSLLFNPDISTFEGEPGSVVTTTVSLSAPTGLEALEIYKTVGTGSPAEYDVIVPNDGENQLFYDFEYTLVAEEVGETVVFEFTLKELTGLAGVTKSITVTTTSPTARSYTAVLLYAPLGNKEAASFFSTNTGYTYSPDSINSTNDPLSADIDFGYYFGTNDFASLASPTGYSEIPGLGEQVAGWGTLNEINFMSTALTMEEFNGISTFADIDEAYEGGTDENNVVSELAVGNILAFETDADKAGGSKRGVLMVSEISGTDGEGDYIKLEIVVQESAN